MAGAAPYVEKEALLLGSNNQPAMLRGVEPAAGRQGVGARPRRWCRASLRICAPGSFNIVLGRELAVWLGVGVGDDVIVMLADFRNTPMGGIQTMKRFKVSGIFEAGYNEFDKGLAVVNLHDLQRLLRMGEGVTGVRLKLHDMDQAFEVGRDLAIQASQGPYRVSDWTQDNANLFRALKMEKTVMAILLSLIIAMGAFNLVSSQVMLVTDKQADIAILRTLGLTPRQVMQVFMVQGSLIGMIGTVLRRVRRHPADPQPGPHPAGHRTPARRAAVAGRRVLHHRPADRPAGGRRDHDRLRGAGDGLRGHPVSGLACGAHRTRGGAAL